MPRRDAFVPLPADGRFDLDRLRGFAREFDQISDEADERYRAEDFVGWIEAEAGTVRHNLTNAHASNALRGTPAAVRRWKERRGQAYNGHGHGRSEQ